MTTKIVNYYDSDISVHQFASSAFVFKERSSYKEILSCPIFIGKICFSQVVVFSMIEKIHKHGQNSKGKIGLIFVLAILLNELEFPPPKKK